MHRIGRTGRIGREGVAITLANPREHRFLKFVEALTKQKIEILSLPSEADLKKKRLEATTEALREQIAEGGFEDVRDIVQALVQEFDVMDVAAAAIKMIHDAFDKGTPEVVEESKYSGDPKGAPYERGGRDGKQRDERGPRPPRPSGPMTLLRLSVGKDASIRPADLVGAIAGEAKISSSAIGAIKIHDDYSLVEIPDELSEKVIAALRTAKIRGHKVTVQSKPARPA